jgi:SAM-dependent methyltransferase
MNDTYTAGTYWTDRRLGSPQFKKKHLIEQIRWLEAIGIQQCIDANVAEIGCGHGLFLDLIKSVCRETYGVDLDSSLGPLLAERGHDFSVDTKELESGAFNVLVSFDTLEHIPMPQHFAQEARRVLTLDGIAYIGVPNRHDFLLSIVDDYKSHFYHKTHLFYYSTQALRVLFEKNGFVVEEFQSVHKYDIMNMITWASDKVGRGNQGSNVFDDFTERAFRTNIERQGRGSHLLMKARRI